VFLEVSLLWVNFTLVSSTPSISLPYSFLLTPHYSIIFNSYLYILYLHNCKVFRYYWLLFSSFPSSPKFHRVVPVLQTYSIYKYAYYHVWFVYMFIFWLYLPHRRENMWPFSFWTWLTSLNMMFYNCIHLPSNHMV
jgi:hypothetical protein